MEIDSETMPSPPLAVQRETNIIPVDPVVHVDSVAPSDIPRDITVGHKRPAWARQTLQEAEQHKALKEQPERTRDPRDSQATFHP
jgi:hypothetical protein